MKERGARAERWLYASLRGISGVSGSGLSFFFNSSERQAAHLTAIPFLYHSLVYTVHPAPGGSCCASLSRMYL